MACPIHLHPQVCAQCFKYFKEPLDCRCDDVNSIWLQAVILFYNGGCDYYNCGGDYNYECDNQLHGGWHDC